MTLLDRAGPTTSASCQAEIEVAILGPVEVRGLERPITRSAALDLTVYLALHPLGTTNEAWATALWPDRLMAPPTLHSTASAARRALGRSAAGEDHLPRSHGRLRLARTVTTDWRHFEELAAAPDPEGHRAALALVRGRPFEGLAHQEWVVHEGVAAVIEERVAGLAGAVADGALADGRPAEAVAAARRGLLASPYDERLYRRLLLAADADGHPAGVERVMAELVGLLEGGSGEGHDGPFDLAVVHPETAALYERLSRRRRPEPGPAARTH